MGEQVGSCDGSRRMGEPVGSRDGSTDGSKAPVGLLDGTTSLLYPLDGATESVGVVDSSSGLVDNIKA